MQSAYVIYAHTPCQPHQEPLPCLSNMCDGKDKAIIYLIYTQPLH